MGEYRLLRKIKIKFVMNKTSSFYQLVAIPVAP